MVKRLKERLANYEIELKIFDINTDEEEILSSYLDRLLIEKHKDNLSTSQLNHLLELDKKAVDLYNKLKNNDTVAIEYLERIVKEFALSNITEYEKLHKKIA